MEDVLDAPRRTQLQKHKKNQNLQWRIITNNKKQSTTEEAKKNQNLRLKLIASSTQQSTIDGGKQSTKDWVLKNFYSTRTQTSIPTDAPVAAVESLSSNGSSHERANNQKIACTRIPENKCSPPNSRDPSINPSVRKTPQWNLNNKGPEKRRDYRKNAANNVPRDIYSPPNRTYASFRQPSLSYAEVLKNTRSNAPSTSPKASVYRSEPAIYFDESVINASAEKFKYCLVGKFPRSWPSLAQIRDWSRRQWKLKGDCFVTLLDLHHVLIRFDNTYDMLHVWVRNRWWINGHLMKVFRWTPNFHPAKEDPSSAAVWISLPFLPIVFFQEDLLFKIANVIGKALSIDSPTRLLSRTNVARICVEVDLLRELPRRVWIGIGGKGFWQHIRYGKLPSYCSNCHQQDHATRICKFSATDIVLSGSQKQSITSSSVKSCQEAKADGNSQEKCRTPVSSVQNCVEAEGNLAKNEQLSPSIQEKDGTNPPAVAASCTKKNKGGMAYGGTFSTLAIMNEVFLAMTEDGQDPRTSHKMPVDGCNGVGLVKSGKEDIGLDEECLHAGNGTVEESEDLEEDEFESCRHDQHDNMKQQPRDLTQARGQIFPQVMNQKVKRRRGKNMCPSSSVNCKEFGCHMTTGPSLVSSFIYVQSSQVPGQGNQKRGLKKLFPYWRPIAYAKKFLHANNLSEDGRVDMFTDIPFFDIGIIRAATDNFSVSNKLGEGGFGSVFKGTLPTGEIIAVKRISCHGFVRGYAEFKNELILLSKTHHRNVVKLLGYCAKEGEKMIIYEYMPNKSLDTFIFGNDPDKFLDWGKRFIIILGIAKGLLYLHEECRVRIIHRDIKPFNVLLDEEFNVKISDFGFARILGMNQTQVNTSRICGTYGYMAPEYGMHAIFSVKSDVYSFGVVLLEIICGKKRTSVYHSEQSFDLITHAWRLWKEGRSLDLMDPSLRKAFNISEALKCIQIALLCVEEDPTDRPTITSVVAMLVSEPTTLPVPKGPDLMDACSSTGYRSGSEASIVDVTNSSLEGR